jgi:flavin-binding protein dodecin
LEDAVNLGVARADATLRGVTSAWIKEQSVDVENGAIVGYRVNLLVTFVLEQPVIGLGPVGDARMIPRNRASLQR